MTLLRIHPFRPSMSESGRAVFLSYASQDTDAATRISDALGSAGIEVWFDRSELRGGDTWDQKIRIQIRECALFLPIISANTQARKEGYFRLEWKLAEDRSHLMARGVPFIVPIRIDETTERGALVPEGFCSVQWTHLSGGETTSAFCDRVKKLLAADVAAGVAASGKQLPAAASSVSAAAKPPTVGRPAGRWLIPGLAGLIVIGLGVAYLPKPPAPAASQATPPPAAKPSAEQAPAKSVVVLPFESLSTDPENLIFTEGMHIETITLLSQLGDVKVISRPSALALKSSILSLAEIGKKLGVANVITGSVRRESGRVRVQLELRRAADEAVLWTKTFQQELKDAFVVQNEIASEVARVLQARDQKGSQAGARFLTKDLRVYDLFVKLRSIAEAPDSGVPLADVLRKAEEIVQMDPGFMPAVSLLSVTHGRIAGGTRDPKERLKHREEAKRWAERASELMPGGAGDRALARYYGSIGDYRRSLVYAENVARALPNDATSHSAVASALGLLGRDAEELAAYDRALELDPLNASIQAARLSTLATMRRSEEFAAALVQWQATQGSTGPSVLALHRWQLAGELPAEIAAAARLDYFWWWRAGRFSELRQEADARLAKPDLPERSRADALWLKVRALRRLGDTRELEATAQAIMKVVNELPQADGAAYNFDELRRARACDAAGRTDEAVAILTRSIESAQALEKVAFVRYYQIRLAEILAEAGRTRECVAILAPLLRVPSGLTVPILRVDPTWDKVRDDARFKALLADPKNNAPLF